MSRDWARGWLWWFAHPSAGVECKEQTLYPALLGTKKSTLFLLQAFQKWQLGFWVFFVSFVQNLPQLRMHGFVFCFLFFFPFWRTGLYFLTGGQVYAGSSIAALQQRVPGPPTYLRMYHLFVCIVIFVSGLCYMKFLQVLFHLIFVFKKQS